MDYTLLYEAEQSFPFPKPIIIFSIVALLLIVLLIIFRNKIGFIGKFAIVFFSIMFLYTSLNTYIEYSNTKKYVYDKYFAGDWKYCEGEITTYKTSEELNNRYDAFAVGKDLAFRVDPFSTFGYKILKSNGGKLDKGIKVKIYYIEYGFDNIIMKLEIASEQ